MNRLIKAGLAFLIGLAVGKRQGAGRDGAGGRGNPELIACPNFRVADPPDDKLVMSPGTGGEKIFGDVTVSWFPNSVEWECEWEVSRGTSTTPGARRTASVKFTQISGDPLAEFGGAGVVVGLSSSKCPQATQLIGVEVIDSDTRTPLGGWDKQGTVYFVVAHFSEYALANP